MPESSIVIRISSIAVILSKVGTRSRRDQGNRNRQEILGSSLPGGERNMEERERERSRERREIISGVIFVRSRMIL